MQNGSFKEQLKEALGYVVNGGPGICNIAITNVCNATCDFCNYARNKGFVAEKVMVGVEEACRALDVLYARGIRYLTFSGGEPMLHPQLTDMVAHAVETGIKPSVCTNGSTLSSKTIGALKEAGLRTLYISIDASSAREHELNRGLHGVCGRIEAANVELHRVGVKSVASVTINKLIKDYGRLLSFLRELKFRAVTFSYPKRALGSPSLVFSEDSYLVDYNTDELVSAFENIISLKRHFDIQNPMESLTEMVRFLKRQNQLFPCFGGYKYFFVDWNLDVYRCDFWPSKMCSIEQFLDTPLIRDHCTRCMSDCYRDSSVMLHFAVCLSDAISHLKQGHPTRAATALFARSNARSIKALIEEWSLMSKLAHFD